ncbi:hypothetical protein, partial [Methanocalculus sp.]|uniref:hypothetical protein n=1 Tax=Methanocalculus sp. TaxID=2004547 RepID=UPI00260835D8
PVHTDLTNRSECPCTRQWSSNSDIIKFWINAYFCSYSEKRVEIQTLDLIRSPDIVRSHEYKTARYIRMVERTHSIDEMSILPMWMPYV